MKKYNNSYWKIDFLLNACKSILSEFSKIQIIGERISTKRRVYVYGVVVYDKYDENMMKKDLKEMLDKYSPIPLVIDEIEIKKKYMDKNKYDVYITVSMV